MGMFVSKQVGEWLEKAVNASSRGEEIFYDLTMAPAGGPNGGPFLAIVLTMRAAVVDTTINLTGTWADYVKLTEAAIEEWFRTALEEMLKQRSAQLGVGGPPGLNGNGPGASPASLYLPGTGEQT